MYIHTFRKMIDAGRDDRKIGRQAYLKAHRKMPKPPF